MRKAPAPGAEVASVAARAAHQTTRPAPDRGRCRKDACDCAAFVRGSRLFFSVLIAECLLRQRLTPPVAAHGKSARGDRGQAAGAIKSAFAPADGAHGKTPASLRGGGAVSGPVAHRAAGNGRPETPPGTRNTGGPGVIAFKPAPGTDAERGTGRRRKEADSTSIIRPTERASRVRKKPRHDGRTNRTGLQTSAGATCGAEGGDSPPDAPSAAPATNRGPVEFADAASGRSTPSGVAACNERTSCGPTGRVSRRRRAAGKVPRARPVAHRRTER